MTALVSAASLARNAPAVYVVENLHWIDGVSESLVADFVAVVPQTHLAGADQLPRRISIRVDPVPGAQRIALAPLSDSDTAALVLQLLGRTTRSAGWPP